MDGEVELHEVVDLTDDLWKGSNDVSEGIIKTFKEYRIWITKKKVFCKCHWRISLKIQSLTLASFVSIPIQPI